MATSITDSIKGRPPPNFSFVNWTKGGRENIINDDDDDDYSGGGDDDDPYVGVAGRFRK